MNRDEQKAPPEEKLTGEEVAKHNSKDSCWVIIHGKAYDVTEVCPKHGLVGNVNQWSDATWPFSSCPNIQVDLRSS